jgi:hypothetical protein
MDFEAKVACWQYDDLEDVHYQLNGKKIVDSTV